jgi:pimeloyl-ACP methyl ester carboxylesterase
MSQAESSSGDHGRYVQINDINMYYEEYGSGDPLILLHGGTVSSSMWKPFIPFFAQHFRVITPDSRGHGRTNNPKGELNYRLMADDVIDLAKALAITKPFICGYSDGGQVALEIGMHYPKMTQSLVVIAAWYRFSESYLKHIKSLGFEESGMVNLDQAIKADPDLVALWKVEHSHGNDPDYWQDLLKQISTMWWTPLDYTPDDFRKISEPTLILVGDRDGVVPVEEAVEIYRFIPNSELSILPNATHRANAKQAELIMNIVLDFFIRHNTSSTQ